MLVISVEDNILEKYMIYQFKRDVILSTCIVFRTYYSLLDPKEKIIPYSKSSSSIHQLGWTRDVLSYLYGLVSNVFAAQVLNC